MAVMMSFAFGVIIIFFLSEPYIIIILSLSRLVNNFLSFY